MMPSWTLHDAKPFSRQAAVWDALNEHCGNLPFMHSKFLIPLLDEFGTGSEQLALGHSRSEIIAAAIITPLGKGRYQSFQPSQLPLGPVLVLPGQALDHVASSLLRALPGLNLGLGLTQLDPLLTPRPAEAQSVRTLDYIETAWLDIDVPFDTYWSGRGKNLRQNMRKQRNKLSADGIAPTLEILRRPEHMAEATREYGVLESAGWKASEGTAIHPDNDQGRFYTAMLQAFAADNRAAVYRYRFNDQVVAMDLCIENEDLTVILKTTYDATNRTLSPAFLMREEQFKHIFDEGRIKRIEFYGKLMEWHTRWTDTARTLYHANYYRWGAVGMLKDALGRLRRPADMTEATATENADSKR